MTERRVWGYSLIDAQIFNLAEGEDLPPGYFDHPDKAVAVAPTETEVESSIPSDWEGLHWSTQVKLAKALSPELAEAIVSKADAVEVIQAYIDGGEDGEDNS